MIAARRASASPSASQAAAPTQPPKTSSGGGGATASPQLWLLSLVPLTTIAGWRLLARIVHQVPKRVYGRTNGKRTEPGPGPIEGNQKAQPAS